MSLRQNILTTYVSQIYVALIGIVMVPFYIRYMGAEAYGLVGFFALLQAWFQLLDMGLTPTIAREAARFNGHALSASHLRKLVRVLEVIFFSVALLAAGAMMLGADYLSAHWLNVKTLPLADVSHAIMLMAVAIALRWVSGLYRGVITGFEQLVWLGGVNAVVGTARFVLVIPFFLLVGTSPQEFFFYQVIVAGVELVLLLGKAWQLLPAADLPTAAEHAPADLKSFFRFALGLAFISSVWVLMTQTDKLILSRMLTLSDYAWFSLAVLVASGISILSGPVSAALMPRLARLSAEGNDAGLVSLYREATQMIAVIAIPVALMLALYARPVLWVWTGDALAAESAAPVLALYALGNGILAVSSFPYYLQYAKGDMSLHLRGSFLFLVLLVPLMIGATWRYGVIGAGYVWLFVNSLYFLAWIPVVHHRFIKGQHATWLMKDIGGILLPSLLVAGLGYALLGQQVVSGQNRLQVFGWIMALGMMQLLVAVLSVGRARHFMFSRLGLRTQGNG